RRTCGLPHFRPLEADDRARSRRTDRRRPRQAAAARAERILTLRLPCFHRGPLAAGTFKHFARSPPHRHQPQIVKAAEAAKNSRVHKETAMRRVFRIKLRIRRFVRRYPSIFGAIRSLTIFSAAFGGAYGFIAGSRSENSGYDPNAFAIGASFLFALACVALA